jgi:hypothetical protein
MKKLVLIALILTIAVVSIAYAGVGSIKLDPPGDLPWPVFSSNPATFETWVEGGSGPAYDLKILVVITEDCYNGLTSVELDNSGAPVSIPPASFIGVSDNSLSVPPTAVNNYQVASLKSHLSYGLSVPLEATDTIYWALVDAPFPEPLTGTHVEFTVEVQTSGEVVAIIYVMGSSVDDSGIIDMRLPPTMSGFVIPEPATIAAVATSIGAFGLYAYHRKRKP